MKAQLGFRVWNIKIEDSQYRMYGHTEEGRWAIRM